MIHDIELQALAIDRVRLMRELAPHLRHAGASHGHEARQRINRERRRQARLVRAALRSNAEAIAARCMSLIEDASP